MGRYVLGQPVRISGTFKLATVLTDPAAVTVRIRKPTGETVLDSASSPAVIRDSVGAYHVDVPTDVEGTWVYRIEGTAPAAGASEGNLSVRSDY